MRQTLLTTAATGATLLMLAAPTVADERRELGAHAHGAATLQIAIEGETVEMALEIPGENAVGFEHAAETDEQRAAVEDAKTTLGDPLVLFTLSPDAGCEVTETEVELHQEGDHNAFEAEYTLTCSNAGAIASVGTTLFEAFPSLEEVEVEYAAASGQGAGELTPDAASLTLPATN